MSERRYAVAGPSSRQREDETLWQVTFTHRPEPGEPADPDADRETVITLPPADVDNMFFDATHTRVDIDALRSGC